MIGRIRTRESFVRLRRHGRRVRVDPFWCIHLTDPTSDSARVAFAINRAVGDAVTRNRLRRRLRAVLSDADFPSGLYLIGCRPAASELKFDGISAAMARLAERIQETSSTVPAS